MVHRSIIRLYVHALTHGKKLQQGVRVQEYGGHKTARWMEVWTTEKSTLRKLVPSPERKITLCKWTVD